MSYITDYRNWFQDADITLGRVYCAKKIEAAPAVKRFTKRQGMEYSVSVVAIDEWIRAHQGDVIHLLNLYASKRGLETDGPVRSFWAAVSKSIHPAVGLTMINRQTGLQVWIYRHARFCKYVRVTN